MLNKKKFSKRKKFNSSKFKKDENDYRVHKPYDKYSKNVMSIAGEGFMKLMGYPIKIKQFHNTEKINEISGELHIDNLIESDEPKMYINEFHTGPISEKDLRRYGSYQVLVFKESGLETIVTIISLDAKEDSDKLYGFGEYFDKDSIVDINDLNSLKIEYGFTPHVKSLTSLDLSLNLNIMDKIIETKKKPDEYDLAILFIIPFMTDDEDKRKELIFKTDELASKLNIADNNLLIDIQNNQRLLANQVLNDEEFKKFLKLRKMLSEEDLHKLDMYEELMVREMTYERIEEEARKRAIKEDREEDFYNSDIYRKELIGDVAVEEYGEIVLEKARKRSIEEGRENDFYKSDIYRAELIADLVFEEFGEMVGIKFREEGEEKVVKKLLEDGFKVDEVLRYTNLNKSQVIALSNAILLK